MDDDVQLFCSEIFYWSLLFVCLIFSVAHFLFVLPPYFSIRQCVILMGVSALHSWHGLGESFSWGSGSLEGIYLS
jgi:hypothetical protein